MADDAVSTANQTQPASNIAQDASFNKLLESTSRPFVKYTRKELLHLSKSPLVTIPDGMPHFKDWFGEWGDLVSTGSKKEPTTDGLGQLSRGARFRRENEEGDGARDSLSSGRPTFKNALSFSQASGSAMGSMGSFRHPSSRLESDAKREEREREGRRETENLRNLSQQFDRERRDREAAPHLPRPAGGAPNANGRDNKSRDPARDSRENAKEPSRRGRGDDAHDWRRVRDDDRQRSRSRQRGKGERESANGPKREKDGWAASAEERRGATGGSGRRRNAPGDDRPEGKTKDDRVLKNDRDKSLQEEQEPAWMGDYIPEAGGRGMLGFTGEDGIQAWKRELKEKERAARGLEPDTQEDEELEGLDDDLSHMGLSEEVAKKTPVANLAEDDGLDEIQRFKKMMQESDRKRREEAERAARELAGKAAPLSETEQSRMADGPTSTPASTLPLDGPPGLGKSANEIEFAPTPPIPDATNATSGRIGGISLGASNWPVSASSASTTPSTTAATLSSGWTQSTASNTDSSPNSRLSPIQSRRFTQDGAPQDGAAVGTRSTSRFANFFGDKQREPSAPQFNSPPQNLTHTTTAPASGEPQLLDNLLARLVESQTRPQAQPTQVQDRSFAQRNQALPPQAQYGNPATHNVMNMQHAQPPLMQQQQQQQPRAQLSMHQQQQQLLSSLNAGVPSNNLGGLQGLNHGVPGHIPGMNASLINPSLNLDIDGRFVSDNLVPGLRPRNGSVAFEDDFQVNPAAGMGRGAVQHRPQQSFDALHRSQQQQQAIYAMNGNRTPSGGFRNGPSPIGGHNPNPMQRGPDISHHLGGMANPLGANLGGTVAGNTNGLQQQFGNRLGAMGNLGNMLGGGPANQPRFDDRQRIQQGQAIHHQGQSLSGMGGLPIDLALLQQQQSQRQMPRGAMPGVGGYPMQQNQSQMGPRNASIHGGIGAQQYSTHMHNDFVVQPNQTTNANDIMAMFLASQGNAGMGA